MAAKFGVDDYAASRVPIDQRRGWFPVAAQKFGGVSSLPIFLLGATLGYGMSFWDAFWAITLGAALLEVLLILVGIIGMREGLSTSLIARWTGFGRGGAALIGLVIGVCMVGWFAVQTQLSAQGITLLVGGLPEWAWSIAVGLLVTLIVTFGFTSLAWTAYLTIPPFLILVGWSIVSALSGHSLADLVASPPPGPPISVTQGAGLVGGGAILAAVIACDLTRFSRNVSDIVKQNILGITLGQYVVGLSGVLLAHATASTAIMTIVLSSVGWVGLIVTVLAALKANDQNLYSASLGVVTAAEAMIGRRIPRATLTLVLGLTGSLLATIDILGSFIGFLTLIGAAFAPVTGIMLAEYFVVRRWRGDLEPTRNSPFAPDHAPRWVPASLVIWLVATVVALFVPVGVSSLNGIVVAFVLYTVAGKLGWVRGVGIAATEHPITPSPEPVAESGAPRHE